MNTLNNIFEELKLQNKKQKDLCDYIGVKKQAFSDWKSGKSNSYLKYLPQIAEFLNLTVDELLGKSKKKGIKKVPVYGNVAAGIPIEAIEDIEDYEELDAEEFKGDYIALVIRGDSMEPKMSNGDVVIVKLQPDVDSGETAVVLINGNDATCKKIKKTQDGIMLLSTNPAYEPMYFTNKEIETRPVKILGKVVELRAKF